MDLHGGSERRTKRSSTDVWEEDRLSSLSDDLLRHILRCLPSTTDAAQTSLLSRRWVRLWVGIPEIWFPGPAVPGRVHAALAAYAAHAGAPIHGIHVTTLAVHPDSNTALRLAAPLLSGELSVIHDQPLGAEDVVENLGVVELPCLENATKVELRLGRLGLAVPESGIFAKLEMLYLKGVRFHGPCEIGDAVSSARCPSLRRLTVSDAQGVHNLNISLQSLVSVELWHLQGLQQLTVVATMLEGFYLSTYFIEEKLSTVNISAPRLEKLTWVGRFEPRFLQRAHLQELGTTVTVHGPALASHHLRLFRHFEFVSLHLLLIYPRNSVNSYKYSMDGVTFLPDMKNLVLSFISGAHTFGACVFHLLRLCAGIRRLKLMLLPREEPPECPLGYTCDQQNGWKSENILLNLLGEAEIRGIKGVEHEVVFLRQLFRWATALEKMTITFDPLVAVSDNLCEEIISFSRSETCVEIYLYRNGRNVLFAPVV